MKRLLIVADDWEALDRYEAQFAKEYVVTTAPFGETALDEVSRNRPDAILVDLAFENMTSDEFIRRLGQHGHGLPILKVERPYDRELLSREVRKLVGAAVAP